MTTSAPDTFLLRYARLHGLAANTNDQEGPPLLHARIFRPRPESPQAVDFAEIETRYRCRFEEFRRNLDEQKLNISIAARNLLASVMHEEVSDRRIDWEEIIPKAPGIARLDESEEWMLTEKEERAAMEKKEDERKTKEKENKEEKDVE